MPSKHLAVVSINDEDDTDDVAVPAEKNTLAAGIEPSAI
jgi:hypothetical protein